MAAERMSATPCTGGRRCDRSQGVLATGRSVSCLVHPVVRHRRPAVRTRPAGHLGENDISDTNHSTGSPSFRLGIPSAEHGRSAAIRPSRRTRVSVIARHRRYSPSKCTTL
ncbi:unnamed protein product [Aphis gossypii]|uniref:Uncharacterized protein n=1 Tax=Aphis gossypii TaxID=80765 RepID=A0A9P0IM92_APHGO|nr:unnamed protein product [Aphis gossypii]